MMHVPHHMQQLPSQHSLISQQSVGAQSFKTLDHALQGFQLPTSQPHVVVQQAPTTGHLVVHHQNSHPVSSIELSNSLRELVGKYGTVM